MTALQNRLSSLKQLRVEDISELFETADRLDRFVARSGPLRLDLSKQAISDAALDSLLDLAEAAGVEEWRGKLFAGEPINTSEDRAVLHPALRGTGGTAEIQEAVASETAKMDAFAEEVLGSGVKSVVHIGIGGSDLGPRLVADALSAMHAPRVELRFAENEIGRAHV